jgi:RND superfamily putative drug exporter
MKATYGVMIYIFQWGNFQNLLGFTSEGFIVSTLPVMMFCVLLIQQKEGP